MKTRIDSMYLLAAVGVFLGGCPIDDARFSPTGSTSSSGSSSGESSGSSSSSTSSSNGSSSSGGGAGGNAGAGGMGGASSSSSSSGGGMAGAGGAGGGPVCQPGTKDSCGTAVCPTACPTLVMVGTGMTTGVTGTFVSSDLPPWKTTPYMNEPSSHVPTLAAMPGKNKVMALLRRTDTLIRYLTWTPAMFSSWSSIGPTVVTNAAVSADATDAAVHVSFYGTNGKHFYAQYTDVGGFVTTAEQVNATPMTPMNQAFGPYPASIAAVSNVPMIAYAGDDKDLYTHVRDGMNAWPAIDHNTLISAAEVPAIIAYDGNPARDLMIVFMQSTPMANQLHWIARENGTWTAPAVITDAKSTEPVLLALPNGDAILTYRDGMKKVWWSRFTGMDAKWSTPQQPPGNMSAKSKPALALGAGDAEVELLFVDDTSNTGYHARLYKGVSNFTTPTDISGATSLVGIAAATNL